MPGLSGVECLLIAPVQADLPGVTGHPPHKPAACASTYRGTATDHLLTFLLFLRPCRASTASWRRPPRHSLPRFKAIQCRMLPSSRIAYFRL